MTPAEAALTGARARDVAIVFAIRVEGEGFDSPDLSLPWGQDAVIEAVAAANPNTIVVLETGNPVAMPWRDGVKAIVAGVVSGAGRRPGDRRGPHRARSIRRAGCRSRSRPTSPRRRGPSCPASARRGARRPPSTTTKAPKSAIAGSRRQAHTAAVRLRARPQLHDLRPTATSVPAAATRSPRASPSPTPATAPAPTCRSSTSPMHPARSACGCSASSGSSSRPAIHAR